MIFFRNRFKRESLTQDGWCGDWVDKEGKRISIKARGNHHYKVTIQSSSGEYFNLNLLIGKRKTKNLLGVITIDKDRHRYMQIEAGTKGIGPTYRLYPAEKTSQGIKPLNEPIDILLPNVGLGLYDDWEDDLGVPWAFPLDEFHRIKPH